MKIIAIYESLNGEDDIEKKILVWPDSAMIRSRKPLFLADDISHFIHLGLGAYIDSVGKSIKSKFACRYFKEVSPMAFIFEEKVSNTLLNHKDPSACDIVRDYSVVWGNSISKEKLPDELMFQVSLNDPEDSMSPPISNYKIYNSEEKIAEAIAIASMSNTIKTGDIVCFLLPFRLKADKDNVLRVSLIDSSPSIETKIK